MILGMYIFPAKEKSRQHKTLTLIAILPLISEINFIIYIDISMNFIHAYPPREDHRPIFGHNRMIMSFKNNNFNPIALRKAKIAYKFGLSECNREIILLIFLLFCTDSSSY